MVWKGGSGMSCPREEREKLEHIMIGPYGILSDASKGRRIEEEECSIRTCFQRDIDRITHSKSFRRLKHKTQVFLQPEGDHYRTRLTHTLEVSRLNPGFPTARRGSLPYPPYPHAGGQPSCPNGCPGTSSERGSGGSHRPRSRSRPHALWPCR